MFQELEYNVNIQKVGGVQFSILSPDEIRRRSVAEIYTNETYDGDIPKVGGLFDPRMGVLDHGKKCPTDELDNRHCPGYFGHIELAKPVFHIHFLKYTIKTLQSVCCRCSKLLISPDSPEIQAIMNTKRGANRFTAVTSLCSKIKRCGDKNNDGCGAIRPNIIRRESSSIGKLTAIWRAKDNKEQEIDSQILMEAEEVERILRRIDDTDIEALGYDKQMCRPEWLICSVLSVPPPAVRPSVRADNNTRMEDDITHKLCDILKTNKTLKYKIKQNANKKAVDEWYQLLQYHVATLINNNLPGIPPAQQRSGRPLKAIADRLKSKEGRVRGNLMGKRVDKSARSVITPDPRLKLNQLGVPIDICKNLTYAEKVNRFNKNKLLKLVRNGYSTYPGAKSIKKKVDGKIVSLSVIDTSQIDLFEGDIVNRHLLKGDIVLFNRQPSLHKMSMMQHEVVPLPYKTFRLNVSVTTPYNADFDGDEMNMHVPQSEQSRIELAELASVPSQIITPAQHKPIISLVQDTCVGSYLFTRYDNYLTKDEIMDIMIDIPSFNGVLPEPEIKAGTPVSKLPEHFPHYKYNTLKDLWSGRQIFSLVIPDINLKKNNKSYDTNESDMNIVNIKNGKVISGVFDKAILGASEQGLIHIIFNEYGHERTQQFLDDIQNIVTNWMLKSGFSVGIGDLVLDTESTNKMTSIINQKKRDVIEKIEHVHKGILDNTSGKNTAEEFEIQILSTLNKATTDTGKIALKNLISSNRMLNMVISGSKGSEINMGQMIACVGQQAVDGKRIPYGFTDRTLPHFHKYDDGASARGFVESSFMKGLTPTEFYFHAMGGREGLIDTAVKTSETGYIQRKLIKGMEDARIATDYTVRNASGVILQFLYGEDGFDGTKIEKQKLLSIGKSDSELYKTYYLEINDEIENIFIPDIATDLKENKELVNRSMKEYIQQIIEDRDYYFNNIFKGGHSNEIFAPINFKRLLENSLNNFETIDKSDLHPLYVLKVFKKLEQELSITPYYKGNEVILVLLRLHLNPKILSVKHRMTKLAFDWIISSITQMFYSSIAHTGDLVGTIAAQSIGEPSTQMTLNTFHFAGVASKANVNQGVPRFKELLSVSKNLKSPMDTIVLKEPYCFNKEHSQRILNELSITTIKQLTISTEIYFDKKSSQEYASSIEEDSKILDIYKAFEKLDINSTDTSLSPWVLRFKLDKTKMMNKNLRMTDIYFAIISKFNVDKQDIVCVFSDDSSSDLIMRIQLLVEKQSESENCNCDEEDLICVLKSLENTILNDIILTGIKDIKGASMYPEHNNYEFDKISKEFNKKTKWVINTDGSNLEDILTHPAIDPLKTRSNDIYKVYDCLGLEAARQVLASEITDVFDFAGSYVNSRHINLLVDIITNRGFLMSIDRHGINKSDRGPLAKCSFEETPDIIAKAAIFGELDKVKSVSSNIMLGQEVPIGTGSVDMLFDEEKYFEKIIEVQDTYREEQEIKEMEEDVQFNTAYCNNLF
tara:strand:- start:10167 stop:14654 length:4488 start_codon:yes stop_codon:yes gene_type:complete